MSSVPTLIAADETFHDILLDELPATIGRAQHANVSVADRWVSRLHCQIQVVDDDVIVRDLGSSHGTFVNGERVTETVLRSGDRLGVGLTSFVTWLEHDRVTLAMSTAG